jgi:hypothetical protein
MQFVASATGTASSGTTIDTSSTLDIQEGDVIVAFVAGDSIDDHIVSVADTDSTNTLTLSGGSTEWWSIYAAYMVEASENDDSTFRATVDQGLGDPAELVVLQFRPASGETVVLDSGPNAAGSGWGGDPTSGDASISADDSLYVGGASNNQSPTLSNHEIGESSCDGTVDGSLLDAGYTIFDTPQTSNDFATNSSDGTWGAVLLVFEIETSAGTDELTGKDMTSGTPTLESPTIGQEHALTSQDVTSGTPTLETPTVGQEHALTGQDITGGTPTLETPTVGQEHALTGQDITSGTPTLEAPTIGQEHALTGADITSGTPTLGTPTLAEGIDALTGADLTSGTPTLGTPTITQEHALTATAVTSGTPTLATPALNRTSDEEVYSVEVDLDQTVSIVTRMDTTVAFETDLEQTVTLKARLKEAS